MDRENFMIIAHRAGFSDPDTVYRRYKEAVNGVFGADLSNEDPHLSAVPDIMDMRKRGGFFLLGLAITVARVTDGLNSGEPAVFGQILDPKKEYVYFDEKDIIRLLRDRERTVESEPERKMFANFIDSVEKPGVLPDIYKLFCFGPSAASTWVSDAADFLSLQAVSGGTLCRITENLLLHAGKQIEAERLRDSGPGR